METNVRERHPFLTDKDWEKNKSNSNLLTLVSEIRENEVRQKLHNFELEGNRKIIPFCQQEDLRLVVIGKTGQGKSATANTILGAKLFLEDYTSESITKQSSSRTVQWHDRHISVIDTPGLQDTNISNDDIILEIERIMAMFQDGIHAFIYIVNMADPRFTDEDIEVLRLIEETFGEGFTRYCILVFSHADSELENITLDQHLHRLIHYEDVYTSENYDIPNYAVDGGGLNCERFSKFLNNLSWQILAVDNKCTIPFEREQNRINIIKLVDRLVKENIPKVYTGVMHVNAKMEKEQKRLHIMKNGWDHTQMKLVEKILALNPRITREELEAEMVCYEYEEFVSTLENYDETILRNQRALEMYMQWAEEKNLIQNMEREHIIQIEDRERKERREREELEKIEQRELEDEERKERSYKEEVDRQEKEEIDNYGREVRDNKVELESAKMRL